MGTTIKTDPFRTAAALTILAVLGCLAACEATGMGLPLPLEDGALDNEVVVRDPLLGKWVRPTNDLGQEKGYYIAATWVAPLDEEGFLQEGIEMPILTRVGNVITFENYDYNIHTISLSGDYAVELTGTAHGDETLFRYGGERSRLLGQAVRPQAGGAGSYRALTLGGALGIRVIVSNLNDPGNQPPIVDSGSDGRVAVPQIIIGEEYRVRYIDTQLGNAEYGFTFTATEMDQDLGYLISTGLSGIGMKLQYQTPWMRQLFFYAYRESDDIMEPMARMTYELYLSLRSTGTREPTGAFPVTLTASDNLYFIPLSVLGYPYEMPALSDGRWTQTHTVTVESFTTGLAYLDGYLVRYGPVDMAGEMAPASITYSAELDLDGFSEPVTMTDRLPLTFYRSQMSMLAVVSDGPLDFFLHDPEGRAVRVDRLSSPDGDGDGDPEGDSAYYDVPFRAGANAPDECYVLTVRPAGNFSDPVKYTFSLYDSFVDDIYVDPAMADWASDEASEPNDAATQVVGQGQLHYGSLSGADDVDVYAFRDGS